MKKLLILGSNYGCVDIVLQSKKMGLYTIVTDYYPPEKSPAKLVADESWNISTIDIDKLEQKCRKENIDAIIAGAYDFNVDNARKLCKRLDLPIYCESDKAWEIANNKRKFKDICIKLGVPVAKDYLISECLSVEELENVQFPVVVKPVDQCANIGMSYCCNEEELRNAYELAKKVSSNSTIIVERELKGPEFAVNYVLADGEIHLLYFSVEHNQPGTLDNLYAMINTTNYHLKEYLEQINEKVIQVFKYAGCKDGIAWVETILDNDGNFYLLEMGYRFGGEMTYVPYEMISGFNAVKWMIECSLGIKHEVSDLPSKLTEAKIGIAASYHIYSKEDTYIAVLEGLDEVRELSNVWVDFVKGIGDQVIKYRTIGVIRLYAQDCDEFCKKIERINQLLRVEDADGNNIIIYYDDITALRNEYNAGIKEWSLPD